MDMKLIKASIDHRCDYCGHKIPAGVKYWRTLNRLTDEVESREHTNCLDYQKEPTLPADFHIHRSKYPKIAEVND